MRNENFEDYLKESADFPILLNNYGAEVFIFENGNYRALPVRLAFDAWKEGGERWGEIKHLKKQIERIADRANKEYLLYCFRVQELEKNMIKKSIFNELAEKFDGLELRGVDLEKNMIQESIYKRCSALIKAALNG